MSFSDLVAADAKLIILRELHSQVDGRLNEISLRRLLDVFGIKRSADWLATQLNALVELGAVELRSIGAGDQAE